MKKNFKYIGMIIGVFLICFIFAFGQIFAVVKIDVYYQKTPINVKTDEVIEASGIKLKTNIFSINEKAITNNVNRYYSDNTVSIIDVERVFPNKIILHIKERIPVFAILYNSNDYDYVLTDDNFVSSTFVSIDSVDFSKVIKVNGVQVENTFNTPNIIKMNEIRKGFSHSGINEEALSAFIKEITLEGDTATIFLRDYDESKMIIDISNNELIVDYTINVYNFFVDAPIAERYNATFQLED